MTNFIYDNTGVPIGKVNANPLPPGVNPAQWGVAGEWNQICQALLDVQSFGRGAVWAGYQAFASDPAPAITNYLWLRTDGTLMLTFGGVANPVGSGGGGSMAIGAVITSATAGSVLYAGTSGILAQDNAHFFWDETDKRLGIGTTTPAFALSVHDNTASNSNDVLEVCNTSVDGYSTIWYTASDASHVMSLGHANASAPITFLRTFNYCYSPTTPARPFVFADANGLAITIFPAAGSVGLEIADGSGLAVSSSGAGRLIFNSGTNKFQVSENGGAYADVRADIGSLLPGSSSPSVLFVNTSNELAQDPTFFGWDDTAKSLMVGAGAITAGSGQPLVVTAAKSNDNAAFLWSTVIDGYAGIGWNNYLNAYRGSLGFGNPSVGITAIRGWNYFATASADYTFVDTVSGLRQVMVYLQSGAGGAAIGLSDGSTLGVSAAGEARIRYNTTSGLLEASKNGGAWTPFA